MANQLTITSALIDSELMDVNLKPEVVTLPFLTITVADDVYPFLSMLTITVGIFANLYGNTTSCSSSLLTANVISTDPCCKLLFAGEKGNIGKILGFTQKKESIIWTPKL